MSTPASTTALANCLVRCGDSAPATVTPASRTSLMPGGDQLGADRLARRSPASAAWPLPRSPATSASSGRVVVAGPQALEVEHAETAEPAEGDRRRRRHHRVHRGGQDRRVEPVGVDLPRGADRLGVAGAPRGHDRDVVEGVGATGALGAADLDLGHTVQPIGRAHPGLPGSQPRAWHDRRHAERPHPHLDQHRRPAPTPSSTSGSPASSTSSTPPPPPASTPRRS